MNAKEALKLTKINTIKKIPLMVIEKISYNAGMGLRNISFDKRDIKSHVKTLRKLGYTVEIENQTSFVRISW